MPNLSETPSGDGEQRSDDPALAAPSELLGPRKGASIYGPIETSGGWVLLVSPLLLAFKVFLLFLGGWDGVRILPVEHVPFPSLRSPLPLSEWMIFLVSKLFLHRHIRTLLRLGQTQRTNSGP